MEFLIPVEDKLDRLDDQPLERHNIVNQLIFNLLIEPAMHQSVPNTLADRVHLEHHLTTLAQHELEVVRYGRVTTLWVHWWMHTGRYTLVDSKLPGCKLKS